MATSLLTSTNCQWERCHLLSTKLAMAAVSTLLVDSRRACLTLNFHCGIQLNSIANTAASWPTTSAWAYTVIHKLDWLSRGLTSHSTLYRSFRGRFLQARWPNQQRQSTEGSIKMADSCLKSFQLNLQSIQLDVDHWEALHLLGPS